MMLRARRTVTVVIEGDWGSVDDASAALAVAIAKALNGRELHREKCQFSMDFLDHRWNVIPAADIVAALRPREEH